MGNAYGAEACGLLTPDFACTVIFLITLCRSLLALLLFVLSCDCFSCLFILLAARDCERSAMRKGASAVCSSTPLYSQCYCRLVVLTLDANAIERTNLFKECQCAGVSSSMRSLIVCSSCF